VDGASDQRPPASKHLGKDEREKKMGRRDSVCCDGVFATVAHLSLSKSPPPLSEDPLCDLRKFENREKLLCKLRKKMRETPFGEKVLREQREKSLTEYKENLLCGLRKEIKEEPLEREKPRENRETTVCDIRREIKQEPLGEDRENLWCDLTRENKEKPLCDLRKEIKMEPLVEDVEDLWSDHRQESTKNPFAVKTPVKSYSSPQANREMERERQKWLEEETTWRKVVTPTKRPVQLISRRRDIGVKMTRAPREKEQAAEAEDEDDVILVEQRSGSRLSSKALFREGRAEERRGNSRRGSCMLSVVLLTSSLLLFCSSAHQTLHSLVLLSFSIHLHCFGFVPWLSTGHSRPLL
jgi:hypothetical protein